MSSRAQVSIEFLALNGLLLLFFILFLVVVNERSVQIVRDNLMHGQEAIAGVVKREVQFAFLAGDGYARHFSLPATINGMNYTMTFVPSTPPFINVGYRGESGVSNYTVLLPSRTRDMSTDWSICPTQQVPTPEPPPNTPPSVRNNHGEVWLCLPAWVR